MGTKLAINNERFLGNEHVFFWGILLEKDDTGLGPGTNFYAPTESRIRQPSKIDEIDILQKIKGSHVGLIKQTSIYLA